MSSPQAAAGVKTLAELQAELRAKGFRPGPGPQITARTQALDAAIVRRSRCPGCRKGGRACHPFHRGGRYKLLAACARCPGAPAEEM